MLDIKPQIHETQRIPSQINNKNLPLAHIIFKRQEIKDEFKIELENRDYSYDDDAIDDIFDKWTEEKQMLLSLETNGFSHQGASLYLCLDIRLHLLRTESNL